MRLFISSSPFARIQELPPFQALLEKFQEYSLLTAEISNIAIPVCVMIVQRDDTMYATILNAIPSGTSTSNAKT